MRVARRRGSKRHRTVYEIRERGYAPIGWLTYATTDRVQFALQAEVQLRLGSELRLFGGAGAQLNFDFVETIEDVSSQPVSKHSSSSATLRPMGAVGLAFGDAFVRVHISKQVEVDLGVFFGR
jgi:hypothetical protein